ncbi:MAG: DeoR/GlpR family DNA-binding transcription regulator [Acetobacterales bacterium]
MSDDKGGRNGRSDMIAAQRHLFILDVLNDQGAASIQQLSDRIGASFSTIRRDLDHLAEQALVVRTRGGATRPADQPAAGTASPPEAPAATPPGAVHEAKRAIGEAAALRVEEGQTVILDSGQTVLEAARSIVARRMRVTAVTNSVRIAHELAAASRIRLILIGGTLRPNSFTLVGEPGQSFLERLHVDVALINTQGVHGGVLRHKDIEIATLNRRMMAAADRSLLLADSWKFGMKAFCEVCPLTAFDEVIVDDGLAAAERRALDMAGVALSLVSEPPAD